MAGVTLLNCVVVRIPTGSQQHAWQSTSQPSPPRRLPSSHCSPPSTTPLPHCPNVSTHIHCGSASASRSCPWPLPQRSVP